MEKYQALLQKKINVELDGNVVNSYKITSILPTKDTLAGRGKLYNCSVDWENKQMVGAHPNLTFDAQTLNDLTDNNCAISPFMPTLRYVLKEN